MSDEERLEEILDRWEDLREQGESISPEELCQDWPELLEECRRRIQELALFDRFLHSAGDEEEAGESLTDIRAGRYRAISLHGEGGLGEVFVAVDDELRRQVALKRLQPRWAWDQDSRSRFLLEAEITGRLEHPGIVPVYGLGQDDRGQPYYAMRFIHGESLEEAIVRFHAGEGRAGGAGEQSVIFQKLLRSFLSVCQTMSFAHSRGVLHRDLKPANIMIGGYGETLVVDWGLAKLMQTAEKETAAVDPSGASEGRPGMSEIGRIKGSLAYMSPEQGEGHWDRVGPASDIFSLGATLYKLLTGRAPFDGDSYAEVVAKVRRSDFVRPRQIRATVPPALEAICLKAMQPDPARRYASAAALAADVERWLADEPVMAWREPWTIRARRWVKKHRTLVTAAGIAILVASVLLTITGIQLAEKNRELADQNRELERRNEQLASSYAAARANFELADRAIRGAAGVVNLRQPGGKVVADPVRKAVNEEARDYYRGFIERNGDRPELAFEVAFACLKQAEAEVGLRHDAAAVPLLDEARQRFQQILTDKPDDPGGRYGTACTDLVSARLFLWQLQSAKSRDCALRACETLRVLCVQDLTELRRLEGLDSPAAQLAKACVSLRDLEAAVDPRDAAAFAHSHSPREVKLLAWLREAEAELDRRRDSFPEERQILLTTLQVCLGEELAVRGNTDEAVVMLDRARQGLATLVKEFPSFYEYEAMLAYVDFLLIAKQRANGKTTEAQRKLTALRDRVRELAERPWGIDESAVQPRTWMLLARCCKTLGDWASEQNRARAEPHYRIAGSGLQRRPQGEQKRTPAEPHYREALQALAQAAVKPERMELPLRVQAMILEAEIAEALILDDLSPQLAQQTLEGVRKGVEALVDQVGEVAWTQRIRGVIDLLLGQLQLEQEKDGLALLDRGIARLRDYLRDHPEDQAARLHLASAHFARGSTLALIHHKTDAGLGEIREARIMLGKITAKDRLATAVKELDRRAEAQIVVLHWMRAEELLAANGQAAAREALAHTEAGLKDLREIMKKDRLSPVERQAWQELESLQAKAEERLPRK